MALSYTPRYISQEKLEARVGANAVRRVLDDNNDGTADADPILTVIRDAEAFVEGHLRPVYPTLPIAPVPTELERLCLDIAHAYLAFRHPEGFRAFDAGAAYERARQECVDLRQGKTRLNVTTAPEPASNNGGAVVSTNGEQTIPFDAPAKVFIGGMGDY